MDPALALQPGFALSVAATGGLLLLAPPLTRRFARRLPVWLAGLLAVALSAQLACLPVLVALWGQLGLVAVPANMLAEPVVPAATVLGVLAMAVAPVWLPAARVLAQLAALPAAWLVTVAQRSARLPLATATVRPGVLAAVLVSASVVVTAVSLRHQVTRRLALAALVGGGGAMTLATVAAPAWPPAGWVLVACDVGQGDGLALRAGPTSAVVIDTGPDPALVDGCLRRLAVRDVPLVVLSHFHADHVDGLPGVLRSRRVGGVLVGPLAEPAWEAVRVREWCARSGVPLRIVAAGSRLTVGSARLDVLAPEQVMHGTDSDPNNDSLVVRVIDGGITLLLTGDVQAEAQRAILSSGATLGADVLKVPHHGSANQDPAFLAAAHARVALISVGAGNTYGQPSPLTLQRLTRDGMPTYRTDLDGDVAVASSGAGLRVVPAGHRRGPGSATLPSMGGPSPPALASAGTAVLPPVGFPVTRAEGAVPQPTPAIRPPADRSAVPRAGPGGWRCRGPPARVGRSRPAQALRRR